MHNHEIYISRCLELAENGLGNVAPNPMVGCIIVYEEKIIGEGYHQFYGGPHAEVNAINSVSDKSLLKKSTLYVNLEPCAHWGKTPPCSDLIIEMGIPNVVIGCQDIFAEVNGKGIEKLTKAGVKVETGILKKESLHLNRRFFTFHKNKRPYIILKWAQTADGFIAREDYSSKWISSTYSRLTVHKWRAEEAAIMVGTNTVLYDNPRLNSRDMKLKNPVRLIIDRDGKIPSNFNVFDGSQSTIVFSEKQYDSRVHLEFIPVNFGAPDLLNSILNHICEKGIQSVIIEGGTMLLQSFIREELWDEARVFQAGQINFGEGIKAPVLNLPFIESYHVGTDILQYYRQDKG
jgi:diaminohydroxyphosphoribosylaminopyrimidine deaminase / 5-amino-6-(5-phosphoribosylamino)uracil reductase